MSIGKKSIARAANAAAKAETKAEERTEEKMEAPAVAEEAPAAEPAPAEVAALPAKKIPEKFKKVSVGDSMPAFLL